MTNKKLDRFITDLAELGKVLDEALRMEDDFNWQGVHLKRTCYACPEQYDAFIGDEQCGYVRLRHGYLTVECPDVGGEMVLATHTKGDGMFDDDERDQLLKDACSQIAEWKRHV